MNPEKQSQQRTGVNLEKITDNETKRANVTGTVIWVPYFCIIL